MKFDNLHQILRSLYEQMMPLCGDMAGVAKGIAGLGALFYVAYRVWQSLARAEPIDVFPMLRPFAIGLCIMFFPTVVLGMTLNADKTFALHSVYIDRDSSFDEKGTYTLEGNILTLKEEGGETSYYKVEENKVRLLNDDKQEITGALAEHYILNKE